MKLETFFEKFDQFADAPNAVARMRALVFELAVRGRLSERRASDRTDSKWLNLLKILDAKDRNSQLGHNPIFDIPGSWRWATLNDLGDTKPRNDASDSATCSFVPMAFISAEYGQAVQHEERIWSEVKKGYTHFSDGDVVMAKITPCFENGKSAIVDNLAGGIGAGTTELHVFRRNSSVIDPRFVLLYLKSHGFIERGVPRMTGSAGQKRVPADYFANSPFPLPPPAEQKRIVAKVDELMALCDRLEAQHKERETRHAALTRAAIARFDEAPTPANLNFLFHPSYSVTPSELRKTILNLAVQGNLVSAQCDTGDLGAKFDGLETIKQRANEETSLPKSWALASYRNLTLLVTSGSRGWKEFYSESGAIFVRTQNIKTDRLVLDDIAYVNLPDSVEGLRAQIKKNDILITITGANVTKAARVEDDIQEAYVSQHIALTRPRWPDMSPWLHLCFIAPGAARGKLEALAYGDKPGLNLNNIRDLVFPIPPLSEQRRIIAEVDRLMEMVGRLEKLFTESQLQAKHLLDAVVHELLHPTADVVEFPHSESNRASQRAAIGCYAIEHLLRNPSFGHTMNMKVVYMAQAHIGLPLDLTFERQAAGPWHRWIEEFDAIGRREGWFTVTQKSIGDGHTKYEYAPKAALKQKAAEAATVLGEHKAEFDRLLALFADMKTVDAEIVATLFAAWNDFLIDGKSPTDDEIIHEVRENWHSAKQRFSTALLGHWLDWMRQNMLVPKGNGPHTIQQFRLQL